MFDFSFLIVVEIFIFFEFSTLFLVNKQQSYPNHILHPEVIPSLQDVPEQLQKRRNMHYTDPLEFEAEENELPIVPASSLQDEVQRAVQNRTVQDNNQNEFDSQHIFESIQSHQHSERPFEFKIQQSFFHNALSSDTKSLTEAFQRIKIAGNLGDMSYIEDLEESVGPLLRALVIREK